MEFHDILNSIQTNLNDLPFGDYSDDIMNDFLNFFRNVPLIQRMVSPDRKRACDIERDESGKIIVDITHPHILEDMDYFRQAAIHFMKTGKYTDLRPNGNPNSEYGKWIREEVRRCHEGLVRPSDGEWIPGDYYFFLNYCPMLLSDKEDKKSRKSNRVMQFPKVWDGHYLKFHYLHQARENGKHALELASRQKGKSFCAAAMLTKRFILGESPKVNKKVTCYATAAEKGYLVKGDQTLDKFQYNIDFLAQNTEWPRRRLINTIQNMQWVLGYQDLDTGTRKGTLNAVMGITSKDDESKLRGTRGVLYIIEEAGSFPRLLELWGNMLPSVEDGDDVYGLLYAYGTSGDNQSDFYAMSEMMYHPLGYHVYGVDNVFDLEGHGTRQFAFFFPGYLNRANCYDDNGNSDVTKALFEILVDRWMLKHNSTDINAVSKRTAEIPIVPQEAIIRVRGNRFPITQLTERLNQIDNDPSFYDSVYVGDLAMEGNEVKFVPTTDEPIRDFPLKDNKQKGAIEIYEMPQRQPNGEPYVNRYIAAKDPVENDSADTLSLDSTLILDLFTDRIVAEYTGRQDYADYNHEKSRLLCIFYNATMLFENNKKGPFAYFQRMHSLHLLADTPQYLKDKQIIKVAGSYGNTSKGVNTTTPVLNYGMDLIKEWLIKPVVQLKEIDGQEVEVATPNLYFIKGRALLKELIQCNPNINVDRVSALIMLMIYREQFMIMYEGDLARSKNDDSYDASDPANDEFFIKNYHPKNAYALKQWYQN